MIASIGSGADAARLDRKTKQAGSRVSESVVVASRLRSDSVFEGFGICDLDARPTPALTAKR